MKNLFNRAMEDNMEDKTIVLKGPLSDVYSNALNTVYAKDADGSDTPSMESAAIDVMVAQQLAKALRTANTEPTDAFQTVYGVSKDNVTEDDVVDVTRELANPDTDARDFILVVDSTQPGDGGPNTGAPQERLERLTTAIEAMVEAHGGKVFKSLGDYAKSRK